MAVQLRNAIIYFDQVTGVNVGDALCSLQSGTGGRNVQGVVSVGDRGDKKATTKCEVIAGITPVEQAKLRSFEVFRNACKDVDVVTFDELLSKLPFLLGHLSPKAVEPARNLF
ncbi:hypothetical protein ACYZUA_15125 [Pseudomonas sp. LS2P72]